MSTNVVPLSVGAVNVKMWENLGTEESCVRTSKMLEHRRMCKRTALPITVFFTNEDHIDALLRCLKFAEALVALYKKNPL